MTQAEVAKAVRKLCEENKIDDFVFLTNTQVEYSINPSAKMVVTDIVSRIEELMENDDD